MKTLLILLCLLHILPAHSSAPLVHFRVKCYDSRDPDDRMDWRPALAFYRMPDTMLTLTTKSGSNGDFDDSLPEGMYTVRYKNIFDQEMIKQIRISPADTAPVLIATDSLSSYAPSTLDKLANGEQLQIGFMSQGCFHRIKQHIIIVKDKKGYMVSLYRTERMDDDKQTEKIKRRKQQRMTRQALMAYDRFENEVLALSDDNTLCTTTDDYTLSSPYQDAKRMDGSCGWHGFYYLVSNIFGRKITDDQ